MREFTLFRVSLLREFTVVWPQEESKDKLASKMANWTVTFNMEMSYFLFLVSAKAMARESELLRDLLEVCEQRDQLQSMLAKDKARYQKEDAQVEAQMQAKILTVAQ